MPPNRLTKRSRTSISFEMKKEICEYMQANPNKKQTDIALHFNTKYSGKNIDRSTIAKIWQDRNKWLAVLSNFQTTHTFRQRPVLFPELDKAMQLWTCQAVTAGIPLNDMILQEKGIEFAGSLGVEDKIKCGNGWVHKFKKRNGLRKINFSGEANSAPLITLSDERLKLQEILANYNREDIYNVDETGLFFRMELSKTLSTGKVSGRKKLVYLPPNTTSHLQPMDAGIIQSFKAKYKQEFCRHLIHQFDRGIDREKNKLNVKEAIDQIAESWNNVTEITIQNCWKKTGILPSNINEDDMDNGTNDVDQESDFEEEIEYLLNLPEIDDICDYLQEFDSSIPTEDILTDEQIINLVHSEENEDDSDTSDEEIPIVSTQQAVNSLQTFIKYFEQQDDSAQYNTNDLRTFQKYLHLTKVKETNSRRQDTLDKFLNN
ncbi:unnamed protein product [Rhizophagus irregularis]|nr:unnamed protein product [Rhizophagus irregularis]